MSIVIYLFLVLLLHASCDARRLSEEINATEFHPIISKLHPARVSAKKASIPNAAARDIAEEEISRLENKTDIDPIKDDLAQVSNTQKSDPVACVSWRVPHRKGGRPESGFNSDYLPPETHPSIHN